MFSEIVFKTGLIAVKSISPFQATQVVVDIYRILSPSQPQPPELISAASTMSRLFTDSSISGTLRHSDNWINKLERAGPESAVWEEESAEHGQGATGAVRLFLREIVPASQGEFLGRISSGTPRNSVSLTAALFDEALDSALIEQEVSGRFRRRRIITKFSENLAEQLRSS